MGRRSLILVLQPVRDRTDWTLRRRTHFGTEHSDALLAHGTLRYTTQGLEPRDLIADIRRIALDLERQYRSHVTEGDPGAPTGGYGGQRALPGMETAGYTRPADETALDSTPPPR